MNLKDLLMQLGIDLVNNPPHKREALVDDACARIEHTWEGASNRLPWHDFCSTEEEKPQELKCPTCNGTGKLQPPPETVGGILADCQERTVSNHRPGESKRCSECNACKTIRQEASKRLRDCLIAAFGQQSEGALRDADFFSLAHVERVLRRELGGERE